MRYADFLAFPGLQLNVVPNGPPTLRMPPKDWKPSAKILGFTAAPPPIMPLGDTMKKVATAWDQYLQAFRFNENIVVGTHKLQVFPEVLNNADDKRTLIIPGLQGVPKDATAGALVDIGIRYCGIAYQGEEWTGGGFLRPELPLTKAGEQFVNELFYYGIIPDISHCGHATARDVLKIAMDVKKPIVASHGGCGDVFPANGRNLPDDILRGVADTGGVVGIVMIPFILGPQPRRENSNDEHGFDLFTWHLVHAVNVCGKENVCIGSDGYYSDIPQDEWEAHYQFLAKGLNGEKMGARFPDQIKNLNTPDKLFRIESLLKGVFPEDVIDSVMGSNLTRFLKEEVFK